MLPRFIGLSLLGHAVLFAALPASPRTPEAARRSGPLVLVPFELVTSVAEAVAPAPERTPPTVAIRRAPSRPLVVTANPVRSMAPARSMEPPRSMEPVSPSEAATARCGAGEEGGGAEEDRGAGAKLEGSTPAVPSNSNSTSTIDVEAVRMAIDRHLVYPLKARRMGWVGRVVVAFEIDERGVPGEVRVASSSGFGSLDDAAVEAVRSAAPFDAPGMRVGLSVPVAFRLGP